MLIEFSVRNFRSFYQTQTLRMTASSDNNLLEKNSFNLQVKSLPRLLRSTVIYGPNAAGKSNLIAALHFMKDFVLSSSQKGQEGDLIPLKPFLFHSDGPQKPSEFEVIFMQGDVRYQYGFSVDIERVVAEWLIAYPLGRPQRWFDREYHPDKKKDIWHYGPKFVGKKKTWEEATRSNALFLSSAIQLNNEQLKPIFSWFRNLVILLQNNILSPSFSMQQCRKDKDKRQILDFMNNADISIDDIKIKTQNFPLEKLPNEMPVPIKQVLRNIGIKKDHQVIHSQMAFGHKINDTGETEWLPLKEESDGTKKLFAYAGPFLDGLQKGLVFLVDELDNSFHSHMVHFILDLFHNDNTNNKNSQLVFTTHNTSILDQKLMRRDQIWFVEKDKQNATNLYSLSDFKPKPRKGEALEKGYLMGRYGAIPYMGEIRF